MIRIRFRLASFLLLAVSLTSSTARADALFYGVTYFGNHLIQIDPTTQIGTDVGALSSSMSPFGLASRNGQLFTFDSNADLVRQINPRNASTLASFNIGIGPVLGQGGLAFRSDGIGFLTSSLNPTTLQQANNLYTFNITAGTSSLVGMTSQPLSALAFGSNGTLYGLGKTNGDLYTVNTATALITDIGNIGGTPGSSISSLGFGPNGTLFASIDDRLFSVNPATGAGTAIDPDPTNDIGFSSVSGLAAAPVPEPSALGLLGLGVVMTSLIAGHRRRKILKARALST